jgi:hypothetical protein
MATYTDQFYELDPAVPPPKGTPITVETYEYVDTDDDGFISPSVGDEVNGSEVTAVWDGDVIRVEIDGQKVWVTGVTFYTADGGVYFTPTDGTILEDAIYLNSREVTVSTEVPVSELGPPCFASGTLLRTASGLVPIDELKAGDMVWTSDNGLQVVRWHGSRIVSGLDKYAPIQFDAGAFGNPRPLVVSPQHRVLVTGWRAQLWFGEDEIFVAAKHLVNGTSIRATPMPMVEYHHILFDGHEIVESEGILSESFHPGAYILGTDDNMREEILDLFPELRDRPETALPRTARAVVRGAEASVLGTPVLMAA